MLTTPPFGPFCRLVRAQSATQPWNTDPLTPIDNQSVPTPFNSLKVIIAVEKNRSVCNVTPMRLMGGCFLFHSAFQGS